LVATLEGRRVVVVGHDEAGIEGALVGAGASVVDLDTTPVDLVVHVCDHGRTDLALVDTDEVAWERSAEAPARELLATLQAAHPGLKAAGGRLLVVLPAKGLAGAAGLVAETTGWEAARLLAVSAARRWLADGIAVNVIASGRRAAVADTVVLLAYDEAAALTGQTIRP
jgi:NAD(P)-dependent dehydrogenase (short-subunit alcohol dehydrogenase family)